MGKIPTKFGNLFGMIETVDAYSSSLYTTFEYGYRSFLTKFGDLIVNWKKSKQGLSSDNLLLYYLLDLSMNQLSGEIPTSFGSLKALKLLNISHNNLSGMVLASLGDLESLEGLDLLYNKLLGSIPQSFAKLQELTILDVTRSSQVRFQLVDKWTQ